MRCLRWSPGRWCRRKLVFEGGFLGVVCKLLGFPCYPLCFAIPGGSWGKSVSNCLMVVWIACVRSVKSVMWVRPCCCAWYWRCCNVSVACVVVRLGKPPYCVVWKWAMSRCDSRVRRNLWWCLRMLFCSRMDLYVAGYVAEPLCFQSGTPMEVFGCKWFACGELYVDE